MISTGKAVSCRTGIRLFDASARVDSVFSRIQTVMV